MTKRPFGSNAVGARVYVGPRQAAVVSTLKSAMSTVDSIVTMSGRIGVGKTTIVNRSIEAVAGTRAVARVGRLQLGPDDVLELLLTEFGVSQQPVGTIQRFAAFKRLLNEWHETGTRVFIVVEDAERIGVDALLELAAMTSADSTNSAGTNIVLMGPLELQAHLAIPALEGLRQRLRRNILLEPFTETETKGYLAHCFRVAGKELDELLEPGAAEMLYRLSEGVPRVVSNICETALIAAADIDMKRLKPAFVQTVALQVFGVEPVLPLKEAVAPPVKTPVEDDSVVDKPDEQQPIVDANSGMPELLVESGFAPNVSHLSDTGQLQEEGGNDKDDHSEFVGDARSSKRKSKPDSALQPESPPEPTETAPPPVSTPDPVVKSELATPDSAPQTAASEPPVEDAPTPNLPPPVSTPDPVVKSELATPDSAPEAAASEPPVEDAPTANPPPPVSTPDPVVKSELATPDSAPEATASEPPVEDAPSHKPAPIPVPKEAQGETGFPSVPDLNQEIESATKQTAPTVPSGEDQAPSTAGHQDAVADPPAATAATEADPEASSDARQAGMPEAQPGIADDGAEKAPEKTSRPSPLPELAPNVERVDKPQTETDLEPTIEDFVEIDTALIAQLDREIEAATEDEEPVEAPVPQSTVAPPPEEKIADEEPDTEALEAALAAAYGPNAGPESPPSVLLPKKVVDNFMLPELTLDKTLDDQRRTATGSDEWAEDIRNAESLEDISDVMAETLFGEEFQSIASEFTSDAGASRLDRASPAMLDSSKNPDAQHAAGTAEPTEDVDPADHARTDTFKSLNPGPKPMLKAGPKPGLPDGPKPGLPDGPKPGLPDAPKPGLPDDLEPGIDITLGDTASPNPPIDTDSIEDQMEVEITASRKALSDEAILKMRTDEKSAQSAEEKKSGLLGIFSRARKN